MRSNRRGAFMIRFTFCLYQRQTIEFGWRSDADEGSIVGAMSRRFTGRSSSPERPTYRKASSNVCTADHHLVLESEACFGQSPFGIESVSGASTTSCRLGQCGSLVQLLASVCFPYHPRSSCGVGQPFGRVNELISNALVVGTRSDPSFTLSTFEIDEDASRGSRLYAHSVRRELIEGSYRGRAVL